MSATQPGKTPPGRRQLLARTVRLPRLSGKASAAWLIFFFLLTGLLIPAVVRLPLWIDFEIVLVAWWLAWLMVLTRLLYKGQRVADDHQLGEPRNWLAAARGAEMGGEATSVRHQSSNRKRATSDSSGGWWNGFFWGSTMDGEAVAIGCLIIVGLVLLVGLIWFLIEIAIPVILFLLYFVARGMLAHVVNDRHHCRGSLGRALSWGFVWATAYTAPLAGVVWFVHFVHGRQGQ